MSYRRGKRRPAVGVRLGVAYCRGSAFGGRLAPWVEQLYAEGVTGGCQTAPLLYCPFNPNTRGQMAVFLVKAFGL